MTDFLSPTVASSSCGSSPSLQAVRQPWRGRRMGMVDQRLAWARRSRRGYLQTPGEGHGRRCALGATTAVALSTSQVSTSHARPGSRRLRPLRAWAEHRRPRPWRAWTVCRRPLQWRTRPLCRRPRPRWARAGQRCRRPWLRERRSACLGERRPAVGLGGVRRRGPRFGLTSAANGSERWE